MTFFAAMDVQHVAVCETFVVPRFLSMFGALMLEMLLACEGAVLANLGCRTGFPDQLLPRYLPGATVLGFDASPAAIDLARTKSSLIRDITFEYRVVEEFPMPVADASFSHAITLVPGIEPSQRAALIAEMVRLLASGGQALYALPLRGSYLEILDLLREYALKHDAVDLGKNIDAHANSRPSVESFHEELEQGGLDEVDVDTRLMTLTFNSGRAFLEDPITRLIIVPDLEMSLGVGDLTQPFDYVREAIDRYWSEGSFELSVNVGCASGRKP